MTSEPLVSVLIPVYNREDMIEECISSVLAQDYTNLEIIVSDNCSTDATYLKCEQMAAREPRVRLVRNKENVGPVKNWQCCLNLARGVYTKFLFSDDLLIPGCLKTMVEALENDHESGGVFSPVLIGASLNTAKKYYEYAPGKLKLWRMEYINDVLVGSAPVSPGAFLLRTEDVKKRFKHSFPTRTTRPFESTGAGPDVNIMLETIGSYGYFTIIPEVKNFFRAHDESFTVGKMKHVVFECYQSYYSYYLRAHFHLKLYFKQLIKLWKMEDEHTLNSLFKTLNTYGNGFIPIEAVVVLIVDRLERFSEKIAKRN